MALPELPSEKSREEQIEQKKDNNKVVPIITKIAKEQYKTVEWEN